MKFYYARVSTKEQKLDRQIDIFKEMGATDRTIFAEKKSGKSFEDREAWKELIEKWAEEGDTIVVKNFDRLGRNKKEVKEMMIFLAKKKIYIESVDQAYLNNFLKGKMLEVTDENEGFYESFAEIIQDLCYDLMLNIDLARAEWERKEIARRRDEGIRSAKKRGVKFGRPINMEARKKFLELYPLTRDKTNLENYRTVVSVAKELNISRRHFYKLEKELIKKEKRWYEIISVN